ncbi:VOC family protein [Methylobacterium sp. J-070]|uniref:VOC family protein n=1 Tax=Methylobacterium sp. J-070 TaxID=2836650 RepID=UPI001FB864BE|nr:VOC family protein [Methylobacterium sp. J-070]MCJ2048947.1 VOC family protein [Methylobacterium sp. J-070]
MTAPLTLGVHHVGLAVPDLDAAERFFVEALGWSVVGGVPDYPAAFVSDGTTMVTLWRVADPGHAVAFDRRGNVGLHHLALKVADLDVLAAAYERVRAHPGVAIEFAPGPMREGSPMHHFICAMPGGVRLEVATAPADGPSPRPG